MSRTQFKVPEMSCGHCKAAIESELGKVPGVERSNADLEKGSVEVIYDEGRVDAGRLRRAIEDAGYTVAA